MLLVDVGQLCEQVAVALIEAMCVAAGAARGDAKDGNAAFPRPRFHVLAEAKADLAISMAVFDDESAD